MSYGALVVIGRAVMTLCMTCRVRVLLLVRRLAMLSICERMLFLLSLLGAMILFAVVPINGGFLRKTAFRLCMTIVLLSTVGMHVFLVAYELRMVVTRGTFRVDRAVRPQKTCLKRLWLGKMLLRPGRKVFLELIRQTYGRRPLWVTLRVCKRPPIASGQQAFFPIAVLPVMTMMACLRMCLRLATTFVVGVLLLHRLLVVSGVILRKGALGLRRALM